MHISFNCASNCGSKLVLSDSLPLKVWFLPCPLSHVSLVCVAMYLVYTYIIKILPFLTKELKDIYFNKNHQRWTPSIHVFLHTWQSLFLHKTLYVCVYVTSR